MNADVRLSLESEQILWLFVSAGAHMALNVTSNFRCQHWTASASSSSKPPFLPVSLPTALTPLLTIVYRVASHSLSIPLPHSFVASTTGRSGESKQDQHLTPKEVVIRVL